MVVRRMSAGKLILIAILLSLVLSTSVFATLYFSDSQLENGIPVSQVNSCARATEPSPLALLPQALSERNPEAFAAPISTWPVKNGTSHFIIYSIWNVTYYITSAPKSNGSLLAAYEANCPLK